MNNKKIDTEEQKEIINDALQLWAFLEGIAKFKDTSYDSGLLKDLKNRLGIDQNSTVDKGIKKKSISVRHLLEAFFASMEPFSVMMRDLLEMFKVADAKYTDNNISINIGHSDSKSLPIDLSFFEKEVEAIQKIVDDARTLCLSEIDTSILWEINGLFRLNNKTKASIEKRRTPVLPPDVNSWLVEYNENHRTGNIPAEIPAQPQCDEPSLCESINRVWNLLAEVLAEYRNPQCSPQCTVDMDRWSGNLVTNAYYCVTYVNSLRDSDSTKYNNKTNTLKTNLNKFLEKLPYTNDKIKERIEEAEKILNLPYWKYRYALYSAWISTQIIKAVPDKNINYEVNNGILSFAFSGSKIATFKGFDPELALYAELRTACTQLIGDGRKRNIQPDFSLVKNDSESPLQDVHSSIIVVECKQYKKPNKKNFESAVVDYSNGRPDAKTILTDYGQIHKTISQNVQELITNNKASLLGKIYPGSSALEEFYKQIKETLSASENLIQYTEITNNSNFVFPVELKLSWTNLNEAISFLVVERSLTQFECSYFAPDNLGARLKMPFNPAAGNECFTEIDRFGLIISNDSTEDVLLEHFKINLIAANGIEIKLPIDELIVPPKKWWFLKVDKDGIIINP